MVVVVVGAVGRGAGGQSESVCLCVRLTALWAACHSRLGLWTIEASYVDDFTTTAKTDFEVKEYGNTRPAASKSLSVFTSPVSLSIPALQFFPAFPFVWSHKQTTSAPDNSTALSSKCQPGERTRPNCHRPRLVRRPFD